MKMRAIILACMIVMSGLIVGIGAQAQTYSGSILFRDNFGNPKDYFDPNETIYFDVTVLDGGVPLQLQQVHVSIVGDGVGQVFSRNYTTDALYGQFSGSSVHVQDLTWSKPYNTTLYTLFVNYSGNPVVNRTFRVYNAVPWRASGFTSHYDTPAERFSEDQRVTVHVTVVDQYGNPYDSEPYYGWMSNLDVWYDMERNGVSVGTGYLDTDYAGEDSFHHYPNTANQFGFYSVIVYNSISMPIGYVNFTVALPDLAAIQPTHLGDNRTVFREGEWVGYTIMLYHQTDIPYDSNTHAARVLLLKEGDDDPKRNNTLNTDADGLASSMNFYNIGHGEEHRGRYYIQVYNRTWHLIGSAMFMVIDIEIGIAPEKLSYAQGDTVTITVTTSLEEAYRVRLSNSAGVTLPSASWNVPAGTAEWWRDYTFPETLPDGLYSVDVFMDTLLLTSRQFILKKINLQVMLSQAAFVPGQSGTVFWRAVNNHDGGPISVTGDSLMHYINDEWTPINKDLPDISGSSGSFVFTVPKDAMLNTNGDVEIEAEDTASHTDTASAGFQVRPLRVDVALDRGSYLPGDTIFITLNSKAGTTNYPVPGVDIRLTVQRDGTTVGSSWTVTSNSAGTVSSTYQIPAAAAKGIWQIVVNATFDANRVIRYNTTREFTLATDPIVSLSLYQQKNVYAPGETVTVPYRVLKDGTELAGAKVTFEAYITQAFGAPVTVALGFGNDGEITFMLPGNMEGTLNIMAVATTTEGYRANAALSIPVSSGQLVLFSVKSTYLPGERVTWRYALSTDTELTATYRITDPDGFLLAQGSPENGTFSFQLPAEHAVNPTARVYVTGSSGTYFATSTAQVYQGYILEFRLLRSSYSPGDVMRINYTIRKVGDVPDNVNGYRININVIGEHSETLWVTEHAGTLEYRLSGAIKDGKHVITVTLAGTPDTFTDVQAFIVDSKAGELAHGTVLGMNAGAFLALIMAIVALIIAIIGVLKQRRMVKPAPGALPEPSEPAPETPYQPPPPEEPAPPVEEYAPADYPPSPEDIVPPEPGQETSYQYPPPPGG